MSQTLENHTTEFAPHFISELFNTDITLSDIGDHVEAACSRVPPLWPLKNFVAVNPFIGLSSKSFLDACALVRRVTKGDMMMPLDYYQQQLEDRKISNDDLQGAIDQSELKGFTVSSLKESLKSTFTASDSQILTVANILDKAHETHWTAFIVDEISKWCSAFYDEGQASWRMPWRGEPLFAAWKQAALYDANPKMMGLKKFRAFVANLPDDALTTIAYCLDALQVPASNQTDFLHCQLMSLNGWSGYVQYQVREKGMYGEADNSLQHLLAICLAYEVALFQSCNDPSFRTVWKRNVDQKRNEIIASDLQINYLWQLAAENAYQRELLTSITHAPEVIEPNQRPTVQAAFCIDVRSEPLRRALEAASPTIETIGFAGFFGFAIEYIPFGQQSGTAQCPALMVPPFRIHESITGATPHQTELALNNKLFSRLLSGSWNSFKTSAVSCFSFVETGGWLSGAKLIKDSLGLHHNEPQKMTPCVHREVSPHKESGMSLEQQVTVGFDALKNMGLTQNLARLVVFCGHGSTTSNNPYASGLDCGACGGSSGEANARVAAKILNNPLVRDGLYVKGISIPQDTYFLAALHNTTTDDVMIFDKELVPATHRVDLEDLQGWFEVASRETRAQRAPLFGIADTSRDEIEKRVRARSTDWAQTRPEWGLAGNASYIVAPRSRTKNLDLGGRAFLNNYDYKSDPDGSKLELVMTAPMIVGSWINLQYFASTVNNRDFGSGNKTIHNVVGSVGIWEGNHGDLRVGLPLQSVHDGHKWMHEPLRMSVLIEAPPAMIDIVIENHANVRELLDNGWLHLIAIEGDGKKFSRYCGRGEWRRVNNIY